MLGELAKRVVNAGVLFLAAVTFFLVPLGDRTPLQHLVAIVGTAPARAAADACADAGRKIAATVLGEREPAPRSTRARAAEPPAPPPPELMPAD